MSTQFHVPTAGEAQVAAGFEQPYEHDDTRELVSRVNDAAELVRSRGESAFAELRAAGSRWRQGEAYVFVLDPEGNMLVHADPALEGRNQLDLKDVNGKPIIRGLIGLVTAAPGKSDGWYHYQWPVPGGLLPRWKSSYVRLVSAPSGQQYVVGSGVYNDRMEKAFVVDAVTNAVKLIERKGQAAFDLLRDPTGPFVAKDAYVFVFDRDGIELVNPAFPYLEGRDILDLKDARGGYPIRDIVHAVETRGSGWIDYLWPKPGDSVGTRKSAYVSTARLQDKTLIVGCGVYLAEAEKEAGPSTIMTAPEVMALVRDAAAVFEEKGDAAFPEFRQRGSRWLRDDLYFFALSAQGIRVLHGALPRMEGEDVNELRDVIGRPLGRMCMEAFVSPSGERWVHYMWPRPGEVFPAWKSTFVKRVRFPNGKPHVIGCGLYNMQMHEVFIEDVVGHAAELIAERGRDAFAALRDKKGPFVFMDTYMFVRDLQGIELVNPVQPSLEGRNLIDLKDVKGKPVVRDETAAVAKADSAWLDVHWFKPGTNTPARKHTYVRRVQRGDETFVIGSGIYVE